MTEVAQTACHVATCDTLDSSFQREIIKNLAESARRLNGIDCLSADDARESALMHPYLGVQVYFSSMGVS